jgi:SAM-dependent methyltransferase
MRVCCQVARAVKTTQTIVSGNRAKAPTCLDPSVPARAVVRTLQRRMGQVSQPTASLQGRSERLREFIEGAPLERESIYRFLVEQARAMQPESRVLDIGAGEAPYRELFAEHAYVTLDHDDTAHSGEVDLRGAADSIPVEDDSFDAIVCTQVLEHVPRPGEALREFNRVLRPGGLLMATIPFAWEEHEAPYDFFRYTRYGIEQLLADAGFGEIETRSRTDCFTTLAQLALNARWAMGSAPDGMDELRLEARAALEEIAQSLVALAPLDVEMILPLGFTVRATTIA